MQAAPIRSSRNYYLRDLVASGVAAEMGLDNSPPPQVERNLQRVSEGLEAVRACLGEVPLIIVSGYRCRKLNTALGDPSDSAHVQGLAVDFIAPRYGAAPHVCRTLAGSDVEYQRLILEYAWVHIEFPAEGMAAARRTLTRMGRRRYALGIVEHATTARPLENYRQAVGERMYPEY